MRVCIHRGTKEIGGTCVEIESSRKRIVLDIGLPLNSELDEVDLPSVEGFLNTDPSLLGIFVSHAHLDHYGLANKLKSGAPFYIGADAKKIINAARLFVPGGFEIKNSIDLKHRKTIKLGPFTVTPYLVDHSAYDAYAFLVAAESKRLFYSGDFRGHGRKGKLFEDFIENSPGSIDVLLMEGSTIGRGDSDFSYPTEDDLEGRLINILNDTKGPALFWSSGQNIDRLVTAYKASRKAGRLFIVDMYTAGILKAIGNPRLPQPGWRGFRVYLPRNQKKVIIENQLFDYAKSFSDTRVYPENINGLASKSLILFRPSMRFELENAQCLEDATLIYSMWPGFLKDAYNQKFLKWLESKNIPLIHCHTSGHAPIQDLQRLAEAIFPKHIVPIHTFEPERYHGLFKKVRLEDDGVWWEV